MSEFIHTGAEANAELPASVSLTARTVQIALTSGEGRLIPRTAHPSAKVRSRVHFVLWLALTTKNETNAEKIQIQIESIDVRLATLCARA